VGGAAAAASVGARSEQSAINHSALASSRSRRRHTAWSHCCCCCCCWRWLPPISPIQTLRCIMMSVNLQSSIIHGATWYHYTVSDDHHHHHHRLSSLLLFRHFSSQFTARRCQPNVLIILSRHQSVADCHGHVLERTPTVPTPDVLYSSLRLSTERDFWLRLVSFSVNSLPQLLTAASKHATSPRCATSPHLICALVCACVADRNTPQMYKERFFNVFSIFKFFFSTILPRDSYAKRGICRRRVSIWTI